MHEPLAGVLALDPGDVKTGWAALPSGEASAVAWEYGILPNDSIFDLLECRPERTLAIEQIRSYGMSVGATVFDTVHWSGRFHQHAVHLKRFTVHLIPRMSVKLHLCQHPRAKDTNTVQAICDRLGLADPKTAKGTKKEPGPLYGIAGDAWQALALAITCRETLLCQTK